MDARRRLFLRSGVQKVAQATVDVAAHQLATRPQNWFRPPFATDEWQFLELCTRCDECLAACPHEVLFPLPALQFTTGQIEGLDEQLCIRCIHTTGGHPGLACIDCHHLQGRQAARARPSVRVTR